MADATGVQIASPAAGAEAPQQQPQAPVVPDKFKNADGSVNTEALLASYVELEKKQGGTPKVEGEQEQQAPAAKKEGEAEAKPDEKPDASKNEVQENVSNVLKAAGLDLNEFNEQFAKDGKLSDESYAKLESKGFSKATVDAFINGQVALNEQTTAQAQAAINEIKAAAGGEEGYKALTDWAKGALTPEQIAEYNDAVSSGKPGIAKAAVAALKAQFEAAEGRDPSLIGGNAKVTNDVFASWHEVETAMSDPRYGKDPAYTRSVEAKCVRSDVRKR